MHMQVVRSEKEQPSEISRLEISIKNHKVARTRNSRRFWQNFSNIKQGWYEISQKTASGHSQGHSKFGKFGSSRDRRRSEISRRCARGCWQEKKRSKRIVERQFKFQRKNSSSHLVHSICKYIESSVQFWFFLQFPGCANWMVNGGYLNSTARKLQYRYKLHRL